MRASVEELENALEIPQPASDRLWLEDCRRLTGPGLMWEKPGAICEIVALDFDLQQVAKCWQSHVATVLNAVGWHEQQSCVRLHEQGLNLAISAPIDLLYSALFVAEASWHYTACDLLQEQPLPLEQMVTDLMTVMASEANPALIALQHSAAEHSVDFVVDDDVLSLGLGEGSQSWDIGSLPAPEAVDWDALHDVPVAMITGTNGKSTSVRLASTVARCAGLVAGITSTDFVRVGEDILDHGDYSGPGGARMLLRDHRTQVAFLEVARGGILRRGLALGRAQAALVTNVAADHLGQYGINTVAALTEVKFSVFRTLAPGGVLVLNADDPGLVSYAEQLAGELQRGKKKINWFSLQRDNPRIQASLAASTPCGWMEQNALYYFDGNSSERVLDVAQIPMTMSGAARYNIQNALGVLCLALAFKLPMSAVKQGLQQFENSPEDNPGRCNEFQVNGARVFVDFAHNPHSIAAVADALLQVPAERRLLMIGHAGDRSNEEVTELTGQAFRLEPEQVVITEVPDYLRGREPGEVSELIRQECLRQGLLEAQFKLAENPLQGAKQLVAMLRPGDLALLLVFSHRDEIIELLGAQG